MRYWYAPLRPSGKDLFTTPGRTDPRDPENVRGPDSLLYIGELSQAKYEQIVRNREELDVDEFGLPLPLDEFGLPI